MKISTTLILLIFGSFYSQAQTQTVAEWTHSNPTILLIQEQDASSNFLKQLDELSAKYIVFSEKLTLEDIENYTSKQIEDLSRDQELIDPTLDEAEFVKMWIGNNLNIKIISKNYFDSLDSPAQVEYTNHTTLILEGDYITLIDINQFEEDRK